MKQRANGKEWDQLSPFVLLSRELTEPIPSEEVFYWRVSTGRDQDPDYQISLARRRGIPEDNIFGDTKSGKNKNREGLKLALNLMRGRPGWTLVVWRLDRLGRNAAALLNLMEEFKKEQWNLVSLTEGIDTRSAMGTAFFGMLAVFAELESNMTSERTRAHMARRIALGVPIGRHSTITKDQFKEMERLLLKEPTVSIVEIGKRFDVSASTVNHHFPGWRSKTVHQRKAWRQQHALPAKSEVPKAEQPAPHPVGKRVVHRKKRRLKKLRAARAAASP